LWTSRSAAPSQRNATRSLSAESTYQDLGIGFDVVSVQSGEDSLQPGAVLGAIHGRVEEDALHDRGESRGAAESHELGELEVVKAPYWNQFGLGHVRAVTLAVHGEKPRSW
jgi:hypothetical protein